MSVRQTIEEITASIEEMRQTLEGLAPTHVLYNELLEDLRKAEESIVEVRKILGI